MLVYIACVEWTQVCVCVCTRWGSICWFSAPLILHSVIFALLSSICFYYPIEFVCPRISITINKAMSLAHSLRLVSTTPRPSCTQNTICIIWCAVVGKQNMKPGLRQTTLAQTHTHVQYVSPHTNALAVRSTPRLDWALSPITDSNYRQSPCVSITSQHNALIRPGLI